MAPEETAREQAPIQKPSPHHLQHNCGSVSSGSKSLSGIPLLPFSSASYINTVVKILAHLTDDTSTTYDDKLARV